MTRDIHTLSLSTVRNLHRAFRKVTRDFDTLRQMVADSPHTNNFEPVMVELTEDLEPGSSATGTVLYRRTDTGGGGERYDADGPDIEIYDPHYWAFGLDGMTIAAWHVNGRWETLPCQNLSNIWAKVKTGVTIAVAGSGLVEVWHGGSASGLEVTAYNTWIDAASIAAGTEVLISWNVPQKKWIVTDNECA